MRPMETALLNRQLSQIMRTAGVGEKLNELLASYQMHHYRLQILQWYLDGKSGYPAFGPLKERYREVGEAMDLLAGRILAIGNQPVCSMRQCQELSLIQEPGDRLSSEEMMVQVTEDCLLLRKAGQQCLAMAEECGDASTVELLDELVTANERQLWGMQGWLAEA